MSLVFGFLGLLFGIVIGAGGLVAAASWVDGAAKILIKLGIKARDAWVLNQEGNEYVLHQVAYDSDAGAYTAEDDDGNTMYFEDPSGLMTPLFKTPIGISFEDTTAIADAVTATAGNAAGTMTTDGGQVAPTTELSIQELQNKAHIGTLEKAYDGVKHRIEYVNPYLSIPRGRTIVDARQIESLLSRAGSSEVPRETAERAAQAERAFEDWGELKRNASLIAAFVVGALMMWLGTSGGGGGGGGVSVPIMLNAISTIPL